MTMDNSNQNNNVYEMTSNIQDITKEQDFKQEETSMIAERESANGGETGTSDKNEKEYKPSEKWRIMKNIVVISLAFMVHFTAFQGAGNLQSSVNAAEGLGTASLATIYFSLILSNVFLPVVMIRLVVYISILIFNSDMDIINNLRNENTAFLPSIRSLNPSIILLLFCNVYRK
jgi:hypothetical protein